MKESRRYYQAVVMGVCVFLLGACGSMSFSQKTATPGEQVLTDLRVMDLSDKTEIVIQGQKPITYTYVLLEDPPRVVINLLSMTRGSLDRSMKVSKGYIQEIALYEGRNPHRSVRVEILLNQSVGPTVSADRNSLLIDFPKQKNDGGRAVDEYRIGPEDVLEILVWKNADLSRTVTVRPDGKVSLPLIGDVQAGGLSTEELKSIVTQRLKEYIASPEVSVLVSNINSYFFYVLGEVVKPGKYPLKERTTLLQAISMAGGFTPFASKNGIALFRKDPSTSAEIKYRVRYKDIISSEDPKKNILIQSGDTIVIP